MIQRRRRFSGTLFVALLCAWTSLFAGQRDPSSPIYTFNITAGPLQAAINQFSEQTGIQITANFGPPQIEGRTVAGLVGKFKASDALDRLLEGSDLFARWEGNDTVHIYPVSQPQAADGSKDMTVTGTRLDGGDGPAPVRVIDRDEIDQFGVSSVAALAGYLTQQSYAMGEWAQRSGAQHFQTRGLGPDSTLVLINGRRAPPSATSVTLNTFDLNTIPLTAVERIEIMSDSASAIYGADAIGGVVNIILQKAIRSPSGYLHYGDAAGGARERRAATSFGSFGERLKSAVTVDYFERSMLVGASRDLWRNQDFTRFGGTDWRVPTANPGNVYSLTSDPLPGLRYTQASVPAGSTGIGLSPEDFRATEGVVSRDSSLATTSFLPDLHRVSAFGSVEFSLNNALSVFGETLLAKSDVVDQDPLPFITQLIVPAENPYNPFGQPVAVDYRLVGMKPISYLTEAELARVVLGTRGVWHRWSWEVVGTYSDERVDETKRNDVDVSRAQMALESTDPQTALNPFTDGPGGSEALLSTLVSDPQVSSFSSSGLQLSGFAKRDLFRLPGGKSEFAFGGEWRQEQVELVDALFPLEQGREVGSGFAELNLPFTKELSVKLAWRGDYYGSGVDSENPQYGLVWRPARDWLMRAAYGTSFRPPSLLELFSPRDGFLLPIADPLRDNSVSLVRLMVGGNPRLGNVSARSRTAGIVYRPRHRPGTNLGVHYWRVVMGDRILVPRASDIERLEELGRVERYDPTEDDRLAGRPGAIESIDGSLLNYGRLETSGVDLDLSYRFAHRLGSLQSTLSATWVDEYVPQDLSPLQGADRVGIASLDGTIPEWRVVGSLSWEAKTWGGSTTVTFTPSYRDADLTGVLNRRLPPRTIVDMQAWVELGRLFKSESLDGLKLTAGAQNLLDEQADFANVGLGLGFDASQADLRQRFTYVRITKAF